VDILIQYGPKMDICVLVKGRRSAGLSFVSIRGAMGGS
jgi:hypothetical protein